MKRLEGKVAVITGAGSGIGRASAKLFVAEGARVVVAEIDAKLGEASSIPEDRPVTEVEPAVWDHTINLDMKGPFLCCRHVIPVMVEQGKGSVVNFSSVVALRGNHIAHVYVMAKGGLISFTKALAGAYSPKGVRVNAICPGVVLTERVAARFKGGNHIRFGGIDNMAQQYPFAVGQPEDIANVALFLASDESRMVNGAAIPAEGGFSAY